MTGVLVVLVLVIVAVVEAKPAGRRDTVRGILRAEAAVRAGASGGLIVSLQRGPESQY